MDTEEAEMVLADAAMRRGLFALLWEMGQEGRRNPRPVPLLDDTGIKCELRRILEGH